MSETKNYEVRLLMEVPATDPVNAVEAFTRTISNEGFAVFMYRVQDLDDDPAGLDIVMVQDGRAMSLYEAAQQYDLVDELGLDDEDEDELSGEVVGVIE